MSDRHFDWHGLMVESTARASVPGTRQRLGMLLLLVALASGLVLLRAIQLELTGGAQFRTEASQPITHSRSLPADRGLILARDGSVLAADAHVSALALHYRWLEQPTNLDWLRRQASGPLSRQQRRDATLVAQRESELRSQRDDLHRRLAQLCGLSDESWQARCDRVQSQVAGLARRVNERRLARHLSAAQETAAQLAAESAAQTTWWQAVPSAIAELFTPETQALPAHLVLAEEQDYHPLVEDLPPEVAAEIAAHPSDYPGVRIVELARRQYPAGQLAAHVVGHLGSAATTSELSRSTTAAVGLMGVERQYESVLCGTPGIEVERLDHRGKSLGTERRQAPVTGQAVRLTLDAVLQRSSEDLLDQACRPRTAARAPSAVGGAIVVLDVRDGQILASASAPRFDPQWFASGDGKALARLFSAPHNPLVDRPAQMAIPPGSVFKTLTAIALVESSVCDPDDEFDCQGYLHEPDRQRCLIFRQQGIGHGAVTLADALSQSCNVYFFHHAGQLGPEPLIFWARRFGFGRKTGVELPGEAPGNLPRSSLDNPRAERLATAQSLAIGQGTLTTTPLQVARMMAAVANGGRLLKPRIVLHDSSAEDASAQATSAGEPILVSAQTLDAVREGLRRTVADPHGTAYDTARLSSLAIAGKTGTAQTASADHAWFAGYAPADEPRVAIVVVLEHGGNASGAARIARDVAAEVRRLGYLATDQHELAAE